MKTREMLYGLLSVLILLFIITSNGAADTPVSGVISSDTTWTLTGSPYILSGSVLVSDGVTLTIEPGVTVKFNNLLSLEVSPQGTLNAVGTPDKPILFRYFKQNQSNAR